MTPETKEMITEVRAAARDLEEKVDVEVERMRRGEVDGPVDSTDANKISTSAFKPSEPLPFGTAAKVAGGSAFAGGVALKYGHTVPRLGSVLSWLGQAGQGLARGAGFGLRPAWSQT